MKKIRLCVKYSVFFIKAIDLSGNIVYNKVANI